MARRTDYRSVENPVDLQLRTIWRRLENLFPTISAPHIFSCSFGQDSNLAGNTYLPIVWFCGDFAAISRLSDYLLLARITGKYHTRRPDTAFAATFVRKASEGYQDSRS